MKSTRSSTVPPYLGVDLTDRYAKNPRPTDVCGLRVEGDTLRAEFWEWSWSPAPHAIDVTELLPEMRESRSVMIDGPQGFAERGRRVRECERLVGAPGRTPDDWPSPGSPYSGFVRSSIELFHALHGAGVPISPSNGAGACEVYPGDAWHRLAGRQLPKKTTKEGRLVRVRLLAELGLVGLPELPTHDQLDAAIGAVLAACVDGLVPGMTLATVGASLVVSDERRLREGPMFVPQVDEELRERLDRRFDSSMPRLEAPDVAGHTEFEDVERAARDLLEELVLAAARGRPTVCTYKEAARRLFGQSWSQGLLARLMCIARATAPRDLAGLGPVRLDTFIVNSSTHEPGTQHWNEVPYGREDWKRALAGAAELPSAVE